MAKYVPKGIEPLLNYVPSPLIEEITSYASKAMRAKILLDREIRGFEKVDRDGGPEAYEHGDKGGDNKQYRDTIDNSRNSKTEQKKARAGETIKRYISIVDIDSGLSNDGEDQKEYDYVQLPFVPRELNYSPTSSFVGIASFGRNNPIYQYTGSEDTLTFEIDWFSNIPSREDVTYNCRWIEALTKSNGYDEPPHRVKLIWGDENKLWQDATWLVTAAPYKLGQFNRGYMDENGNFKSTHMLPQQARQTVTLKRLVEHNRTSQEIIGNLGKGRRKNFGI